MYKPIMIRMIENFDKSDKITILKFLRNEGVHIVESNTGSHINLDELSPDVFLKLIPIVEEIHARKLDPKYVI